MWLHSHYCIDILPDQKQKSFLFVFPPLNSGLNFKFHFFSALRWPIATNRTASLRRTRTTTRTTTTQLRALLPWSTFARLRPPLLGPPLRFAATFYIAIRALMLTRSFIRLFPTEFRPLRLMTRLVLIWSIDRSIDWVKILPGSWWDYSLTCLLQCAFNFCIKLMDIAPIFCQISSGVICFSYLRWMNIGHFSVSQVSQSLD